MPARAPTANASAVAVQIAWAMKLLSSLIVCPAPGPPTWNTFSANARSTGSSRAKTSGSAPTMTLSLPSSASAGVRASGASTKATPAAAQASRSLVVESGSLVERRHEQTAACRGPSQAVAGDRGLDLGDRDAE